MVIGIVGFGIIHQEMVNPSAFSLTTSSGVSNLTTNLTDYITLAFSFIPTLIFGGAGNTLGTGIGKIIRRFQQRNNDW